MAKTTKSNPDGVELGLLIQAKSDGDYFHITAHRRVRYLARG